MGWFTKDDVNRASDVFLSWLGRISTGTKNTYDDDFLNILSGQKDSFVNIVSKLFGLDSEVSKVKFAPAPVTMAALEKAMPGITEDDVAALDGNQKQALITIAKAAKK